MQPTHTPGPWHLSDETNPLITNDSGSVDVAQVFMYSEGTVGSLRPNAYADARLLAAAPELLDAMREMLHQFADHEQYDEDGHDTAAINKARAAIAKATGEAA